MEEKSTITRTALHAALLVALCIAIYSNTLHAPFVFDDGPNITDNAGIKDARNIPRMFVEIRGQSGQRPVMLATFAINHALGGIDPAGYHIFNIALHALNCILLYLLVRTLLMRAGFTEADAALAALLGACLFAAHPVQTESVTYTVSRSELLYALFYLAGAMAFIRATDSAKITALSCAIIFILSMLGMGSRESFITYPAALVMLDYLIISGRDINRMKAHLPLYACAGAPALYLAYLVASNDYRGMAGFGMDSISPLQYLMTQFHVLGTYLRLLVLPIRQNVDYDYAIARSLLSPSTLAAMLGYASLWGMGLLLMARGRSTAAFGVLFFLIALLPDSSFVPLNDVISEHRLYLSSASFFCLASGLAIHAARSDRARKSAIAVFAVLIVIYGTAAYSRNATWRSAVALWSDAAEKSPMKARPHNNLAIAYKNLGQFELAIAELERTVQLIPENSTALSNLGAAYNAAGMPQKAIAALKRATALDPENPIALYNLGQAYGKAGETQKQIECYERALALGPNPVLEGLREKIEELKLSRGATGDTR